MNPLSLYIHVPFCTRRCSYCSFYHVQSIDDHESAFLDVVEREISHILDQHRRPLRTVFIGGGTPSVLQQKLFARLFASFQSSSNSIVELSVEVNPEDADDQLVAFLADSGVNRISLGVQSMNAIAQKVLKRCPPEQNQVAFDLFRQRFDNISVDVLLGIPGSSLRELQMTVNTLIAWKPEHFSVYCLEPGGDMADEVERFFSAVDSDRSADEYLWVCDALARHEYEHYEISNFARPGRHAQHNRVYWDGSDYVGVGPGAHSFVDGQRYHNAPSLSEYLRQSQSDLESKRIVDEIDADSAAIERMMLGLRTNAGVPREWCQCEDVTIEALESEGLAVVNKDQIRLTDRGFLIANEIMLRLSSR